MPARACTLIIFCDLRDSTTSGTIAAKGMGSGSGTNAYGSFKGEDNRIGPSRGRLGAKCEPGRFGGGSSYKEFIQGDGAHSAHGGGGLMRTLAWTDASGKACDIDVRVIGTKVSLLAVARRSPSLRSGGARRIRRDSLARARSLLPSSSELISTPSASSRAVRHTLDMFVEEDLYTHPTHGSVSAPALALVGVSLDYDLQRSRSAHLRCDRGLFEGE